MDRHFPPKSLTTLVRSTLKNVFQHQKCLFRSEVWPSVSPSHLSTIWTKTGHQISLLAHSGSHISLSKSALENWNILTLTRTTKLYPVVHCVLLTKGAPNPALKHFSKWELTVKFPFGVEEAKVDELNQIQLSNLLFLRLRWFLGCQQTLNRFSSFLCLRES